MKPVFSTVTTSNGRSPEDGVAVKELETLTEELDEHATRLQARAKAVRAEASNAQQAGNETLARALAVTADSIQEQVDTGLDFQRELIVRVGEALSSLAKRGSDEEPEVGLEPEDADKILAVLNEHLAMVESVVQNLHLNPQQDTAQARLELQGKIKMTRDVIELVNGLVLEDEDDDSDEGGDDAQEA